MPESVPVGEWLMLVFELKMTRAFSNLDSSFRGQMTDAYLMMDFSIVK